MSVLTSLIKLHKSLGGDPNSIKNINTASGIISEIANVVENSEGGSGHGEEVIRIPIYEEAGYCYIETSPKDIYEYFLAGKQVILVSDNVVTDTNSRFTDILYLKRAWIAYGSRYFATFSLSYPYDYGGEIKLSITFRSDRASSPGQDGYDGNGRYITHNVSGLSTNGLYTLEVEYWPNEDPENQLSYDKLRYDGYSNIINSGRIVLKILTRTFSDSEAIEETKFYTFYKVYLRESFETGEFTVVVTFKNPNGDDGYTLTANKDSYYLLDNLTHVNVIE